ncbi:tRNA pseudouridine synthase D [Longimycelium tulufanense]|uniref:tRNA pseudouridine synthase D n=1 Tax=Longimycelium tulufanense TaxID=907463 RepID=A0A8J3CBE7_9PSEU|nr:tRNA pseudouridine(13) synthase TruD [Longimycelium tulufanense]GGM48689.1 tRNA pseudouridine synthase D [Longimycelium tulufanense]
MTIPVLKAVPEDFVVTECLPLSAERNRDAPFQYLKIHKRGYTTFQALDMLATGLSLPPTAISAAGLKDEDAVTEQLVAVRGRATPAQLDRINTEGSGGEDRWIQVAHAGYGSQDITIGGLHGNSFQLVVRNLDADLGQTLRTVANKRINMFFVNYYDTQRFGVAGGPKQTHLIGQALLSDDYPHAFELLRASGSAEGARALEHNGDPRSFFTTLDPRTTAFYRSAYSSYHWNRRVGELLVEAAPAEAVELTREDIPYVFPTSTDAAIALLTVQREVEYTKYRWRDGAIRRSTSSRPTVVQSQVNVENVQPDDLFPGSVKATLSFFLPSGCYATTMVSQLFLRLTCHTSDAPELAAVVV